MTFKTEGLLLLGGVGNEVLIGVAGVIVVLIVTYLVIHFSSPTLLNTTTIPGRVRESGSTLECSICLGDIAYAVETNCGHIFCGECILNVYQRSSRGPLETPTCPYCRQRMTMLLPYFSTQERLRQDGSDRQRLLDEISSYNRLFGETARSFREQLMDLPVLLRHLLRYLLSFNGVDTVFRLRLLSYIVMAFLYFVLPFDLVPEILFGIFGYLDDVAVVVMVLMYSTQMYRSLVAQNGII